MAGGSAKPTIDHEVIRRWVEDHGGQPAHVKRTGGGDDPGILRIDFPGFSGEGTLEPLSWDEWFQAFEANNLAFIYQNAPNSRFNKLVSRDRVDAEAPAEGSEARALEGTEAAEKNLLDVLVEDHTRVRKLFEDLKKARSAKDRETVFTELAAALHVHSLAEQEVVYPALAREPGQAKKLAEQAVAEHQDVELSASDIDDFGVSDEDFKEAIDDLEGSVEAHLQLEEGTIFPILQKALDDVDLDRLGRDFIQAREEHLAAGDVSPSLENVDEDLLAGESP